MNNVAGIDVSKGKSMVSVLRPFGEVVAKPFSVGHTGSELKELADYLKSLDGETRVVMEHTGRYYEPVAGVDPGANQSGTYEAKSVRTSKSGPPELRKALFLVMDCLLKTMPQDDPVYLFMDKKRAEGKPYLVYTTAGANKFLRIYYGRVKEYLASLEAGE